MYFCHLCSSGSFSNSPTLQLHGPLLVPPLISRHRQGEPSLVHHLKCGSRKTSVNISVTSESTDPVPFKKWIPGMELCCEDALEGINVSLNAFLYMRDVRCSKSRGRKCFRLASTSNHSVWMLSALLYIYRGLRARMMRQNYHVLISVCLVSFVFERLFNWVRIENLKC